jgi:uncharacterized protein (UPF0332 family)
MNPLVASLLEKARESRNAAELLRQESYPDFAASRAYYALFYIAEAMLLERGLAFSSHSAVIAAFGKEFAKTGAILPKFHRYLIDAEDLRNVGDYGVGSVVTNAQVQELLEWVDEFITTAEAYLTAGS